MVADSIIRISVPEQEYHVFDSDTEGGLGAFDNIMGKVCMIWFNRLKVGRPALESFAQVTRTSPEPEAHSHSSYQGKYCE